MKQKKQWNFDLGNKGKHATMKSVVINILYTDRVIRKVMKNINYFRPDLKQFFTIKEELNQMSDRLTEALRGTYSNKNKMKNFLDQMPDPKMAP